VGGCLNFLPLLAFQCEKFSLLGVCSGLLHELLERLDAHLKAEQFYSGQFYSSCLYFLSLLGS
jgi:hypothetical protein